MSEGRGRSGSRSTPTRGRKKKRSSPALYILLGLLALGVVALGVVLVMKLTGIQGGEPTLPPGETAYPAEEPTPEITPEPTEDITMGGIYSAGGVEREDEPHHKIYKTTQYALDITRHERDGAAVWVAQVWVRDATQLQNCFAQDMLEGGVVEYAQEMAQRKNAVFAVNADYAAYRTTGVIVRDGRTLRDIPAQETLALFPDGLMKAYDTQQNASAMEGAWHTWSYGPSLLTEDGAARGQFDEYSAIEGVIDTKMARSGVGMIEPNHYIFAVVDAPRRTDGLTLAQFAQVFAEYHCTVAYNFEGSAAAAMLFEGEFLNTVHGEPGTSGPRRVSEIIYLTGE